MALYVPTFLNFPTSTKKNNNKSGLCQMCSSEPIHTCFFLSSSPQLKGASSAHDPARDLDYWIDIKAFAFRITCTLHTCSFQVFTGYHCNLLEPYAVEPQQRPQVQPHFLPSFGWTAPIWTGVHGPVRPFLGGTGVRRFGVRAVSTLKSTLVESRDNKII